MKKNIIKLGFVSVCLLGSLYFYSTSNSEKSLLNDLTFKNIDALASGEDQGVNFDCIGRGDIDCYGYKVARKYTGLRLD